MHHWWHQTTRLSPSDSTHSRKVESATKETIACLRAWPISLLSWCAEVLHNTSKNFVRVDKHGEGDKSNRMQACEQRCSMFVLASPPPLKKTTSHVKAPPQPQSKGNETPHSTVELYVTYNLQHTDVCSQPIWVASSTYRICPKAK